MAHALTLNSGINGAGLFDRARGRLAGSDEYLTKPFTKESLLRSVASYTHGRPASTND